MPSTVADILAAAGAAPTGVVPWGTPPKAPEKSSAPATGIYVVALTADASLLDRALPEAPISTAAIDELLAVRPELTLDGVRPTRDELAERLAAFWLPDEVVLYIGLAGPRARHPAGGELAKRVSDYYTTPLGARSPHAGGWPLKTLSCLDDLHVHHAYCGDVDAAEGAAIGRFAAHVSQESRAALYDQVRVMPFANLEFPKGNAKAHGIRGARAPRNKAGAVPSPPVRAATRVARPAAPPSEPSVGGHRSQNVTANDISVGQVRIPIGPTKSLLPADRRDITVVLRGRRLECAGTPATATRSARASSELARPLPPSC